MITLHQLLKAAVKQGASDIHLVVGSPPVMRIKGKVVRVKSKNLTSDDTRRLCYSILTDAQKSRFEEYKEMDFSFGIRNLARFRANLFFQRGSVSGVFRRIPISIPEISTLGIPKAAQELIGLPTGMIIVTGPTGSGKSTTIAAMIDKINRERRGHIITIEDPIEYIHHHKSCIVNQREVGHDTESFESALKYVLRQDPDICLMGEMRDRETIEAALRVAETGHLVFATLHTNNSIQTINRIIGVFPAEMQDKVRLQLSLVVNGIISQRLMPTRDGGMVSANEYLAFTPNVRNLIRENKLHQIYGIMQVGQEKTGMVTLNQSLMKLVLKRRIDVRTAFANSSDPEELDVLLGKAGV